MKYEIMVILSAKKTEKEIEKQLEEIKGAITENGFQIVDEDIWGERTLAYKIKGNSAGYYAVLVFEGENSGMIELKSDLNIMTFILRQMIIKVDDDYALVRHTQLDSKVKKLSKHAAEIKKKVSKKSQETEDSEDTEPEDESELDEKLQAIIDDTDIDI